MCLPKCDEESLVADGSRSEQSGERRSAASDSSRRPASEPSAASDDPAATTDRLEDRIEQIASALENQHQTINSLVSGLTQFRSSIVESVAEALAGQTPAEPSAVDTEECCVADEEKSEEQPDVWQKIRNETLDAYAADETPQSAAPGIRAEVSTNAEPEAASPSENGADQNSVADLDAVLARIPALGIGTEIPDDRLRDAIDDRDQLIRLLTVQLHRKSVPLLSPDQLRQLEDGVPDDLRERIEEALAHLDRQVRLGELELSLERARIGRQVTTLEATREKLKAAARSFGLTLNDDGTLDGEAKVPQKGSRGRRWLGVMGFGN